MTIEHFSRCVNKQSAPTKSGSTRCFTLLLRHPLLHLNFDFNTLLRVKLVLGVLLPGRIVRELLFYGLLTFLLATYPPPKGTFLLRCSIVFPHTNRVTSTTFLDYFRQFSTASSARTSPSPTSFCLFFLIQIQLTLSINSFFFGGGGVASLAAHVTAAVKKWRRSPQLPTGITTYQNCSCLYNNRN